MSEFKLETILIDEFVLRPSSCLLVAEEGYLARVISTVDVWPCISGSNFASSAWLARVSVLAKIWPKGAETGSEIT